MAHIIFSITLVAKNVAHALEMAEELKSNGVESSQIQSSVNVARTSAPANSGDKGEHELAYTDAYGRTRITDNVIALCGLTGTREQMFQKLKALRDSGVLIKNAMNNFALSSDNASGDIQSHNESKEIGEGIDLDNCV